MSAAKESPKDSAKKMTFGGLLDATALAYRETPVKIRTPDGEVYDLTGVEIPLTDLDEGKKLGDQPEGHSREGITVWLDCG
jgi:hypothetical protein